MSSQSASTIQDMDIRWEIHVIGHNFIALRLRLEGGKCELKEIDGFESASATSSGLAPISAAILLPIRSVKVNHSSFQLRIKREPHCCSIT